VVSASGLQATLGCALRRPALVLRPKARPAGRWVLHATPRFPDSPDASGGTGTERVPSKIQKCTGAGPQSESPSENSDSSGSSGSSGSPCLAGLGSFFFWFDLFT
jgi:hypothetical protein